MLFVILPSHTTIDIPQTENVRFLSKGSVTEEETLKDSLLFDLNKITLMRNRNAPTTFHFLDQQVMTTPNAYIGTEEIAVGDEPITDYDVNIKLPIKTIFKIKAKIKSVSKFVPKPFID